jgi:hypothetical protein
MSDWISDRFREGMSAGMSAWMEMVPGLAESTARMFEQTADLFGFTPATAFGQVIDVARRRLIGRETTFDLGGAEVTMTLESIDVATSPLGPAIGQLGDLTVSATELRWHTVEARRVDVTFHNVHLQPRSAPVLVIAPLTFSIEVAADEVLRHVAETPVARHADVSLGDGVVTLRHRTRTGLGSVDGVLQPAGDHVRVDIDDVRAANRWSLGRAVSAALPTVRLPLPEVLHDRVRSIDVRPEGIVVHGLAGEFREAVRVEQVDALVRRITAFDGDPLVVPRRPPAERRPPPVSD